jgi:hypothetical protein
MTGRPRDRLAARAAAAGEGAELTPRAWLWVEALREVRRDPVPFVVLIFGLTALAVAFLFVGGRP